MEDKTQVRRKKSFSLSTAVLIICVLACVLTAVKCYMPESASQDTEIDIVSTLVDAIDIEKLSTAEYTYNGVAEISEDGSDDIIYVRYSATVKVGIDISKVSFKIDDEQKLVIPILPQIEITNTNVGNELSFIPEGENTDLNTVLNACAADVINEASSSAELLQIAETNLRATIEALIMPIIEPQGFTIYWEVSQNGSC